MKTTMWICILFCTITTLEAQIPYYIPTNGLVGWWPFNGNANDESGNGNNGTVNGATLTTDRKGINNSAYYFSGASCQTRIDVNINTTSITSGLTLSFWSVRSGSGCISPRIMEFWNGNSGIGTLSIAHDPGNNPIMFLHNTSGGRIPYIQYNLVANNVWSHYVYTNNGITAKLYQDGSLVQQTISPGQPLLSGNAAFGRMNHPGYDAHEGKLDDIGIWNRALSESEITALYLEKYCPPPENVRF